ncbi:MAG: SH3 domain-containing protein [Amphiplicatus sp.]
MSRLVAALAALSLYLTAPPLAAQAPATPEGAPEVRTDTPSGYRVPRFVSLKGDKTYCRLGPSFEHPVVATYLRAGTPALVIAETTDHWRKIRDRDGFECWVHETTLRALTHVLVDRETAILAEPEDGAPLRARLAEGVMAQVLRKTARWRLVSAGGIKGWAREDALWGASVVPD